jgi:ATP/maltotriose-dependent transcriptional regulator MalT
VLGQAHTLQGRHDAAREWLERGIAACEALGDDALQAAFVVDPGVTLYASLAIPLLHLGEMDAARARVETALERARRLGQPMAQMVALWFATLFEVRLQDAAHVAAHTAALVKVVDGAALAQGRGPSQWFRGWLLAANGDPRAGHALIRSAHDDNVRLGMLSGGSEVLGYAAEALVRSGDLAAAQAEVDAALRCAERLGERVYVTQLHLLDARIASAQGDGARARAATQRALGEARAQRSPWLETLVSRDPDRIPTVS